MALLFLNNVISFRDPVMCTVVTSIYFGIYYVSMWLYSGMLEHAFWWKLTDAWEVLTAFIIRAIAAQDILPWVCQRCPVHGNILFYFHCMFYFACGCKTELAWYKFSFTVTCAPLPIPCHLILPPGGLKQSIRHLFSFHFGEFLIYYFRSCWNCSFLLCLLYCQEG
jgi:hypothetical protein